MTIKPILKIITTMALLFEFWFISNELYNIYQKMGGSWFYGMLLIFVLIISAIIILFVGMMLFKIIGGKLNET